MHVSQVMYSFILGTFLSKRKDLCLHKGSFFFQDSKVQHHRHHTHLPHLACNNRCVTTDSEVCQRLD